MKDVKRVSIFKQIPDTPLPVESTFEAGFQYTRALRPDYSDQHWCEGLVHYLDRGIRRFPKDLTAHVQRVNALVAAGAKGDRLFAAAVDLNTVLGSNGVALQQRIHGQISFALNESQRADLVAISTGIPLSASAAKICCSLPRSNGSSVRIVSEIRQDADKVSDPLGFAIDLLNAGDYAESQSVLERAALAYPDRKDIANELQGIYRAARDTASYEKTRTAIAKVSSSDNPLWPPTDSFFSSKP